MNATAAIRPAHAPPAATLEALEALTARLEALAASRRK
jgi:hypothetical protein